MMGFVLMEFIFIKFLRVSAIPLLNGHYSFELIIYKYTIMKSILFIMVFLFSTGIFAQELNKVIKDPELEKEVLIGKCDRNGMLLPVFSEYFNEGYGSYVPNQVAVKQLKKKKKGVEVAVIMASWCGDSKEQVPRFFKILDEIKFDEAKVNIIAVDKAKTGGAVDVSGLNIERVPTFIFYRDGREIGRIIETPVGLLERDMLLIFILAD